MKGVISTKLNYHGGEVVDSAILRPRPSRPGPRAPHKRGPTFPCFSTKVLCKDYCCYRCVKYLPKHVSIQSYGERSSKEGKNVLVASLNCLTPLSN